MEIRGRVIKYGEDVNTDVIIPSKYLVYIDFKELAKYAMSGLDENFRSKVKDRTILVAGKNFGCGSSREQAPIALKYAGIQCIVADSFARIFYRNAVNIGLPILEYVNASAHIDDKDEVYINLGKGIIIDITKNEELKGNPVQSFILEIMEKGLIKYVREKKR